MNNPLARLAVSLVIGPLALLAAETEPKGYDVYGIPKDDQVVTPVGYERRITLDTGETVRLYPDRLYPDNAERCHAVLFYILSPDTLRGKYFLLNKDSCWCYMCRPSDSVTNLFRIGYHYTFPMTGTMTNVTRTAFELGSPGEPFMDRGNEGEDLYCNTGETDERLRELNTQIRDVKRQLKNLQQELARLPDPKQVEDKDRWAQQNGELWYAIDQLQEQLTNDIPRRIQRMTSRRDWLKTLGSTVTNRVEPDRMCWNAYVREWAGCQLPAASYHGATLGEILADICHQATSNGVIYKPYFTLTVRGCPSDVEWGRKYDCTFPAGSVQELLLRIGSLPDVSMKVYRSFDNWSVSYSVPGDSPYVDWSKSLFSAACPEMELKDVTAYEALLALDKALRECFHQRHPRIYGFHVNPAIKEKIRHSFSFTGKTFRAAISEIEEAYGVVYNYERGKLFDPHEPLNLTSAYAVRLQKRNRSVWIADRMKEQWVINLEPKRIAMLDEMMKRCDVASRDFVCCDYFFECFFPASDKRVTTTDGWFGIMTDDARREALGFDLGSRYGNALTCDSRQRHYVWLLQREEDRRELYSFLTGCDRESNVHKAKNEN